ncbi:MAG: FAD:protein FMN transferase [Bradyrhizobium sp.]|nr:MAG: FAD:protein FMN transferase [Bradyrhizobium sp.]
MGMPITIDIVDADSARLIGDVFAYFTAVDAQFSVFRLDSEISALNRGRLSMSDISAPMQEVLAIADRTKSETHGYFDIRRPDGSLDPSGVVKGWAIRNAADLICAAGRQDFYVDAGGDIQTGGVNAAGEPWKVGIRNPFNQREIVKAIRPEGRGVATSGSYVRGQHIYDPYRPGQRLEDIVSLTVVGGDVLEADRFATAAFAMGRAGIHFIEERPDLEGYAIDAAGVATKTRGFERYATS